MVLEDAMTMTIIIHYRLVMHGNLNIKSTPPLGLHGLL